MRLCLLVNIRKYTDCRSLPMEKPGPVSGLVDKPTALIVADGPKLFVEAYFIVAHRVS
jgi:hypothetical protein